MYAQENPRGAPHAAGDRALGAGAGLKNFGYEREPS
jgi:hypothetical protein